VTSVEHHGPRLVCQVYTAAALFLYQELRIGKRHGCSLHGAVDCCLRCVSVLSEEIEMREKIVLATLNALYYRGIGAEEAEVLLGQLRPEVPCAELWDLILDVKAGAMNARSACLKLRQLSLAAELKDDPEVALQGREDRS
jgi:hypothetical protein